MSLFEWNLHCSLANTSFDQLSVRQPGTDFEVPLPLWLQAASLHMGGVKLVRKQVCVFWWSAESDGRIPTVPPPPSRQQQPAREPASGAWRSATIVGFDAWTGISTLKYHHEHRSNHSKLYLPLAVLHFARLPPPPGTAPRSFVEGNAPLPGVLLPPLPPPRGCTPPRATRSLHPVLLRELLCEQDELASRMPQRRPLPPSPPPQQMQELQWRQARDRPTAPEQEQASLLEQQRPHDEPQQAPPPLPPHMTPHKKPGTLLQFLLMSGSRPAAGMLPARQLSDRGACTDIDSADGSPAKPATPRDGSTGWHPWALVPALVPRLRTVSPLSSAPVAWPPALSGRARVAVSSYTSNAASGGRPVAPLPRPTAIVARSAACAPLPDSSEGPGAPMRAEAPKVEPSAPREALGPAFTAEGGELGGGEEGRLQVAPDTGSAEAGMCPLLSFIAEKVPSAPAPPEMTTRAPPAPAAAPQELLPWWEVPLVAEVPAPKPTAQVAPTAMEQAPSAFGNLLAQAVLPERVPKMLAPPAPPPTVTPESSTPDSGQRSALGTGGAAALCDGSRLGAGLIAAPPLCADLRLPQLLATNSGVIPVERPRSSSGLPEAGAAADLPQEQPDPWRVYGVFGTTYSAVPTSPGGGGAAAAALPADTRAAPQALQLPHWQHLMPVPLPLLPELAISAADRPEVDVEAARPLKRIRVGVAAPATAVTLPAGFTESYRIDLQASSGWALPFSDAAPPYGACLAPAPVLWPQP